MLFLFACSVTKQIPPGDALYTGSKIKFEKGSDSARFNSKNLDEELSALIRPTPNKSFLGLRFKLMIFNMVDTPRKDHGLKHWLKYKVGEPPVLASSVNLQKNSLIMQNRLENRGFFASEVTADTTIKNKKMEATFTASVHQQYKIRNVYLPKDSGAIYTLMRTYNKNSLLKPGRAYNLELVKNERERINTRLKQNGFYYFKPEDLIVDVDSSLGNYQVDMYIRFKQQTPFRDLVNYRINDVVVYADYDINSDTNINLNKVRKFQRYKIIDPEEKFNPKLFPRTLVFKPGSPYRSADHSRALNRLTSLGVYKFVKVRFEEVDTSARPLLNAFYYLTPAPKKSISIELSGLTKSNNATGTNLSVNWKNRNFFRGAEQFTASVYGGFEKQISGQQRVNTTRAGVDLNLIIPRIVGPIVIKNNGAFVPQTVVNLGYEIFSRDTQYTLNSARLSLGYRWKRSIKNEHEWRFLSFSYVRPTNITENFQKALDTNITLARSIEKQFILGMMYNYNYNSQAVPNRKKHNYYFNGNIDVSGNALGLITGANAENDNVKTIFGTPFSQYIRGEADFRYYMRTGRNSVLASRTLAGLGYAYGNSLTMPFIKQFFAGGVNDIRAFRARSLGPGQYYAGNPKVKFVPDQPGDVKLLVSTEIRQKLVSILYGAVFLDAGNVWTLRTDSSRIGSRFTSKFLNDFAVGGGIGLRVDVKFFVLRVDLATPLRKPYITEGSKWTFNDFNIGNSDWRKNNLILNIAIGYPF